MTCGVLWMNTFSSNSTPHLDDFYLGRMQEYNSFGWPYGQSMKISRGILEKTYSLKTNIFVKSCHLKMLRAIAATEEETEKYLEEHQE